jgi:hypothetical protein
LKDIAQKFERTPVRCHEKGFFSKAASVRKMAMSEKPQWLLTIRLVNNISSKQLMLTVVLSIPDMRNICSKLHPLFPLS